MIVVYTTVFGPTDPLHEPRKPDGFRFVCFTDRPLKSRHWEIVQVPATDAPARECRKLKQLSHVTFPEADATLWLDAAFELLVSPAKVAALATADMVGFKHPDRTRISQEAPAIARAGKGLEGPTMAQLETYQAAGWDTDDNPQRHITNGGFLFRRHTPAVQRFNEAWHREVQTRTLRDQMSIDYCAWREGVAIGHYPGNVRRNNLARIHFLRGKRTTDF
jgi:hypothetical protein